MLVGKQCKTKIRDYIGHVWHIPFVPVDLRSTLREKLARVARDPHNDMALASAALGSPFVGASLSGRLRGVARATSIPRGEHLLPRPPGRVVRATSRSAVVTWASGEDRFAHVRPGNPDPRNRADIAVGAEVDIVLKADQGTGRRTRGVVREFLTNSKHHPQGIKVRLVDGAIGRVERVVSGSGAAPDASEPSTSSPESKPSNPRASSRGRATSPSAASPDASATVYLTNVPKALGAADVRWLLEEIPGVAGARLPRRGGKNMGYAFITCEDAESAAKVMETLNGMELEGKTLVAEPAREKTRTASPRDGDAKKKTIAKKEKARKRGGKGAEKGEARDGDEDGDGKNLDPIARARREMEAEAMVELERARRAGERRAREAEERARARREKEAAAEARTTAMLAERRRRAEEAAAAAEAKRAREAALREEAEALGPIRADPAWEDELVALAEELAALRSAVE